MSPRSVFEEYAHEYDLITNAAAREKYHAKEVRAIIKKFQPGKVLDAGCASGLTAMLFARNQVTAVGLDRSRPMIVQAKTKFDRLDLPLSFRQGNFEDLPKSLTGRFDLVVCLANSISGVGSLANLKKSFRSFCRVLKPGGTLVLQALNYASMKEGDIYPIRATENDGIGYLRYARRLKKAMEISVVRLNLKKKPFEFEPFCHSFENFSPVELSRSLRAAGFIKLHRFGDLYLQTPFVKTSRDIIITAHKPALALSRRLSVRSGCR